MVVGVGVVAITVTVLGCYLLLFSSSRVEVTRAVLNQGKRFVAVMALDTGAVSAVHVALLEHVPFGTSFVLLRLGLFSSTLPLCMESWTLHAVSFFAVHSTFVHGSNALVACPTHCRHRVEGRHGRVSGRQRLPQDLPPAGAPRGSVPRGRGVRFAGYLQPLPAEAQAQPGASVLAWCMTYMYKYTVCCNCGGSRELVRSTDT